MLTALVALSVLLPSALPAEDSFGFHERKTCPSVVEVQPERTSFADYLDRRLNYLYRRTHDYPPRFDTPQERQRAVTEVTMFSGMLDALNALPAVKAQYLWRAGLLYRIGHNLDIPGAADKADAVYRKLLAMAPRDPGCNYMYGDFLVGSNRAEEALPYLERALSIGGMADAAYSLGIAYVLLGDKDKALESMETYKSLKPEADVDKVIELIREDKLRYKVYNGFREAK